jgi:WD40 repeat protein
MKPIEGAGHSGQVVDVVRVGDGFVSTSFDDTVKQLSSTAFSGASLPTGSQPKALAVSHSNDAVYLLTSNSLEILSPKLQKIHSLPLNFTPLCIAASPNEKLIAIGGEDSSLAVHDVSDPSLPVRLQAVVLRSAITSVAFSPKNNHLAVGLSTGHIPLYKTDGELVSSRWSGAARVQALRWNAEGTHVAAASLDESISVYSVAKPGTVVNLPNVSVFFL